MKKFKNKYLISKIKVLKTRSSWIKELTNYFIFFNSNLTIRRDLFVPNSIRTLYLFYKLSSASLFPVNCGAVFQHFRFLWFEAAANIWFELNYRIKTFISVVYGNLNFIHRAQKGCPNEFMNSRDKRLFDETEDVLLLFEHPEDFSKNSNTCWIRKFRQMSKKCFQENLSTFFCHRPEAAKFF